MPENKFAKVSCSAKAVAKPPTPKAVINGEIETPKDSSKINMPMA
jgi:hypothetical protein